MAKRRAGVRLITGDKEIDAALERLKVGVANKIARPGLMKAARVILKAQKSRVPPDKKYIKQTLGMAVNAKRGVQRAKVGAGVGKGAKAEPKRSGRNTGGVGIGGRNVHWALLGTESRTTKTTNKSTGAMPAQLPGLIQNATNAAMPSAMNEMRQEVTARLHQLAAKK